MVPNMCQFWSMCQICSNNFGPLSATLIDIRYFSPSTGNNREMTGNCENCANLDIYFIYISRNLIDRVNLSIIKMLKMIFEVRFI